MNDMRFLRQQDVVDAEKLANLQVTLIGLGSIGSVTGLYLAKMGVVQSDLHSMPMLWTSTMSAIRLMGCLMWDC
jgi:tRNA A37 threonylcarbamoyladenosine dehydratase